MQYLGIDWGTRRASWCAIDEHGALREGAISADRDGLSRLAFTLGGDEEVRGCVEMNVKLLRLNCAHGRERSCPACAGGAPGADTLRAVADHLVERAGIARWRFRVAGHGSNLAGAVAFLVPKNEVDALLARIAPVASRAPGVAVVPTGPWPAYSFALPLDRPPLARVESRERHAGHIAG